MSLRNGPTYVLIQRRQARKQRFEYSRPRAGGFTGILHKRNVNKVVFIVGTGHAGSTLLDLLVGSHSRAFSLGELVQLTREDWLCRPTARLDRLCSVCRGTCPFWGGRVSAGVLRRYFYTAKTGLGKAITRLTSLRTSMYGHFFEWTGADILVDSSKKVGWVKRQLRSRRQWRAMSPVLLWITRDGRAVVNSTVRKYPEKGIATATREWKDEVGKVEQFYGEWPTETRYKIAYENLVTAPSDEMRSLCRFLGIDFEPAMLRYWEHDHHIVSGNLGTRSLIFRYRRLFQSSGAHADDLTELRLRHGDFYDQVGTALKLDLRWRRELSPEQLEAFESIAGDTNRPYAYGQPVEKR